MDGYYAKSNMLENLRHSLKLNNHRKDVSNLKVIPASYLFKTHVHNFMKHVKFTQIEKLSESSSVSKDTLKPRLKL